jgi:hypothetical protein
MSHYYFSIGIRAGSLVFRLISLVLFLTSLIMFLNLNFVFAFNGSNYGNWKARMRFFQKSIDVWHIVESGWTPLLVYFNWLILFWQKCFHIREFPLQRFSYQGHWNFQRTSRRLLQNIFFKYGKDWSEQEYAQYITKKEISR